VSLNSHDLILTMMIVVLLQRMTTIVLLRV